MKIARETLTPELFAEILPLARKCWDESTALKANTCAYDGDRDFEVEPDVDEYLRLANVGALVVMTGRDDGRLVAYAVGVLYRSMHHRKVICALGDSIYLEPDYRGHAGTLANRFEYELAQCNVGIIGWPALAGSPVAEFLSSRGYVPDDTIMEKRLNRSVP